jgi:disulfide bond formation protein DsbB
MYPLVVVLGVATLEERARVWKTALPLSIFGGVLAAYHSLLQITATSCSFGRACGAVLWEAPVVGLTIPNLSLLGFLLVIISVFAAVETDRLTE